jgi:L,D-transpeptidase YcbB
VGGQQAVLFDGGAPVLDMKVIVGTPRRHTPMFASRVTSVVFDPPWNVPTDIAQHEILPKAARNPGYLARENFTWTNGRLQQRPGPKNALGLIKFDLPSPFGVYLHDTPSKSLFARKVRTLSHGCMRLEKPQALAETLLAPQGWSPERVSAAMAAGQTQTVPLKQTVPLFVVYWTVIIGADGAPMFRPDVYGWDRKLSDALASVAVAAGPAPGSTECRDASTN